MDDRRAKQDGNMDAQLSTAAMLEPLAEAVRAGMIAAVSDPKLWHAASEGLSAHAKAEAGGWMLGGVRAALGKIAWFLLLGSAVYMVGGWSALIALFKTPG